MDARQHARLARLLVASCGGVDEVVRNQVCRLRASRLYETMDPQAGAFLPIDAVAELEAYCGEPLYSRELVEARPHAPAHEGAREEACELSEEAVAMQAVIRQAAAGGRLTPREQKAIEALIGVLEKRVAALRTAVETGAA